MAMNPSTSLAKRAVQGVGARAGAVAGRAARRLGVFGDHLYYGILSGAFRREHVGVGRGIEEHLRPRSGGDVYTLRRNLHMLEKGLTMRPLRAEFGLKYVSHTVELVEDLDPVLLSSDERRWARDVLSTYFHATEGSTNPTVERARTRWEGVARGLAAVEGPFAGPAHPDTGEPPADIDALLRLATRRKSVRWFLDRPVPRGLVDKAVAVAAQSPTACNRQPFRFEIFDDRESVRRVAAIPMGTAGYRDQIQGLVVVVGELSAFFDERDRHLIYIDASLAAMSFVLGLESQGIASCCINWPDIGFRERAMASLLGLERHERVVMLIAYGYADPTALTPASEKRELRRARIYRELG